MHVRTPPIPPRLSLVCCTSQQQVKVQSTHLPALKALPAGSRLMAAISLSTPLIADERPQLFEAGHDIRPRAWTSDCQPKEL